MTGSYRRHFSHEDAGTAYDAGQYRHGSFWDVVWALERPVLDRLVADQRKRTPLIEYLDFACGTGRVLSYLEDRVDDATGVDVSGAMLERAATRVKRARLVQVDLAAPGAPLEGRYDLITAFRFVLNAEPRLQREALAALAGRLRDAASRLVLNTHGNPWSYKGIVVPVRRALRLRGKDENLLGVGTLGRLLAELDLEVVERHGMGIFPSPLWRRTPRLAVRVEGLLMRAPLLWRLGVNQVLICRRKT